MKRWWRSLIERLASESGQFGAGFTGPIGFPGGGTPGVPAGSPGHIGRGGRGAGGSGTGYGGTPAGFVGAGEQGFAGPEFSFDLGTVAAQLGNINLLPAVIERSSATPPAARTFVPRADVAGGPSLFGLAEDYLPLVMQPAGRPIERMPTRVLMRVVGPMPEETRMPDYIRPYRNPSLRGQDRNLENPTQPQQSCAECESALQAAQVICSQCRRDVDKCQCAQPGQPMMMLPMETPPGQELRPMPMQPGGRPKYEGCPPGFHQCGSDAECEAWDTSLGGRSAGPGIRLGCIPNCEPTGEEACFPGQRPGELVSQRELTRLRNEPCPAGESRHCDCLPD